MTLRTTLLKLGAAAAGLTASVSAFAADTLDKGDTAWMLVATVLVLFMTIPGIALFYAGMARKKNILGTIAQDFAICGVGVVAAGVHHALEGRREPFLSGKVHRRILELLNRERVHIKAEGKRGTQTAGVENSDRARVAAHFGEEFVRHPG